MHNSDNSVDILRRVALRLKVPYQSRLTALYLLNKALVTNKKAEKFMICACLSISMKACETVRKLKDIYQCLLLVMYNTSQELDSKQLSTIRDSVMNCERILLEQEEYSIAQHSCRACFSFVQLALPLDNILQIAANAWRVFSDAYSSFVCARYPQHIVAFAAARLAFRMSAVSPPKQFSRKEFFQDCSIDIVLADGAIVSRRMLICPCCFVS